MKIDARFVKGFCPTVKASFIDDIVNTFNQYSEQYEINTVERLAAFMSQLAHESAGLTTVEEGGYFSTRTKIEKHQKSLSYYPWFGRGFIQTTLKANYEDTSLHIFGDTRLLQQPNILLQPKYAMISAMYFWHSRGLNKFADYPDTWRTTVTRTLKGKKVSKTVDKFGYITYRINGWFNGYEERISYWKKAKNFLKGGQTISFPKKWWQWFL